MKDLQIAIHCRKHSFSERWIEYCQENGISYKIVNCYDSDIISQLSSVDILLWHWNHSFSIDVLIAQDIIYAAESMGLKVFPDTRTCWSFDNKVSQKYLLESIGAPVIPSYVFYDRHSAMDWIKQASFPKVFKLRRGAGSKNVKLVCNIKEARSLIKRSFGRGFVPSGGRFIRNTAAYVKKSNWQRRFELLKKTKRFGPMLMNIRRWDKEMGLERGYVFFQDFIPDNKFDTRITVISNHSAFGFTRNVRKNDFRASGSGSIDYNIERINPECIKIAFDVAGKLLAQSIAFDFVIDNTGQPWIAEISYGYESKAVYNCPGYWDDRLQWHQGHIWPQDLILKDILKHFG